MPCRPSRAGARPRRRASGHLGAVLGVLAFAALGGAWPGGGWGVATVQAQTTQQLVEERRLEYEAARAEHEAALRALRVLDRQFTTALNAVGSARARADEDALNEAMAAAYDRAIPLGAQRQRVADARERLDDARQALIDVLAVRLEELLARMDAAASAEQRAELDVLWRDLDAELRRLEAEGEGGLRLDPVVFPEITFDPRDTSDELIQKAEILERLAAVADTVIQEQERRIQDLRDRLRTQRGREDFIASTGRFDDTRVPVVTGNPAGDRDVAAADSVRARPLTLEERIARAQEYRQQLLEYRDELLIRAEQFRRRVGIVASEPDG